MFLSLLLLLLVRASFAVITAVVVIAVVVIAVAVAVAAALAVAVAVLAVVAVDGSTTVGCWEFTMLRCLQSTTPATRIPGPSTKVPRLPHEMHLVQVGAKNHACHTNYRWRVGVGWGRVGWGAF